MNVENRTWKMSFFFKKSFFLMAISIKMLIFASVITYI